MKRENVKRIIIASITAAFTLACCMLPKIYKGSIEQSMQEGLIIYDNGVQDLILKVSPKISGQKMPKSFCWLITVPNEPDNYEVVKPEIFDELYSLKRKHLIIPVKSQSRNGVKSAAEGKTDSKVIPGVELGKYVKVGAYDIQPVRGVGENAYTGLNKWLGDNGFPTEPQEHMQYFIDSKFTFLCIKVNPADQEQGISLSPKLKPLHMTFKSKQIYYPMKYSSQQGDFRVNLYTLTTKPIDYDLSAPALQKIGWANKGLYKNVDLINKTLKPEVNKVLQDKELSHLYFNNFRARPNNNKAIEGWKEDVFLTMNSSHSPNKANRMKSSKISWSRTLLLILAIFVGGEILWLMITKKKKVA